MALLGASGILRLADLHAAFPLTEEFGARLAEPLRFAGVKPTVVRGLCGGGVTDASSRADLLPAPTWSGTSAQPRAALHTSSAHLRRWAGGDHLSDVDKRLGGTLGAFEGLRKLAELRVWQHCLDCGKQHTLLVANVLL